VQEKLTYVTKTTIRRLAWAPTDFVRQLQGQDLTPPRGLSFVGRGDFEQIGQEYLGHFKELGGLQPKSRVLDIGCGIGRMAIPLMDYLEEEGSYAGFDVGKEMIGWCKRHITRRRPDFEFTWAPVYNRKYNPFGSISGAEFRFPYPDSSFDFTFATSLFTHLVQDDAQHYLAETSRVLRPGGTCLLTFFLIGADAEREMEAGRAALNFRYMIDGELTADPRQPEESIAYRVDDVRAMLADAELSIREPIFYGLWANTPGGRAGQDIIIAGRQSNSLES
jgi:ubiquinone/menaquinone biosynthesis C-methylase UbiE